MLCPPGKAGCKLQQVPLMLVDAEARFLSGTKRHGGVGGARDLLMNGFSPRGFTFQSPRINDLIFQKLVKRSLFFNHAGSTGTLTSQCAARQAVCRRRSRHGSVFPTTVQPPPPRLLLTKLRNTAVVAREPVSLPLRRRSFSWNTSHSTRAQHAAGGGR